MARQLVTKTLAYNSPFQNAQGGTFAVYLAGAGATLAQIYDQQSGGFLLPNPITIGADSRVEFWVDPGNYRYVFTDPIGGTQEIEQDTVLDERLTFSPSGELFFEGVDQLESGTPLNFDQITSSNVNLFVGRTVETKYDNSTSKAGGAKYVIWALDDYRDEIGDGVWVPDGYVNHEFVNSDYVAILQSRPTIANCGATYGSDDSSAAQALFNYCNTFGTAEIISKNFAVPKLAINVSDINFDHVNIVGNDNILKAAPGASSVLIHEASGDWDYCEISSLKIDGNSKASNGLTFLNPFGGRIKFDKFRALNCDVGILKAEGNIGNTYYDLTISYCNYGMFCTSVSSPTLMHSGADMFYHGHLSNCSKAAIYIDSPASGTGQWVMDGTILEYNQGFGIFVENFLGAGNPLELRNVWFEGNHTSPSVVIMGTLHTPRDLYLKNVSQGKVFGTVINSVEIISSDLIFEQCKNFGTQYFSILDSKVSFYRCLITADMEATNSTVLSYDSSVGVGVISAADIVSAYVIREGSLFYSSNPLISSYNNTGVVAGGVYVDSFDGNSPNLGLTLDFSGGKTYPVCLTQTASGAGRVDAYSFSVAAGELYYIKCEVRLNSTDVPTMLVQGSGGVVTQDFSELLVKDKWVTVHLLGRATNTGSVNFWCTADGGSISLSFGACTVVKVTDVQRINEFFNSGQHIAKNAYAQCISSTIPSTAINMAAGDYCKNSNPTVDGNNMILDGWVYDGSVWQPKYISTVSPAS